MWSLLCESTGHQNRLKTTKYNFVFMLREITELIQVSQQNFVLFLKIYI